jgi:hypothetical protein
MKFYVGKRQRWARALRICVPVRTTKFRCAGVRSAKICTGSAECRAQLEFRAPFWRSNRRRLFLKKISSNNAHDLVNSRPAQHCQPGAGYSKVTSLTCGGHSNWWQVRPVATSASRFQASMACRSVKRIRDAGGEELF